jgi:hypothetical protein
MSMDILLTMLTWMKDMNEEKYVVYFEKSGFRVSRHVDYWIDSSTSEKFYEYSRLPKDGFPCNRISSITPVIADDGSFGSLKVEFAGTDIPSSTIRRENSPNDSMKIRIVRACIDYSYIPLREREKTRPAFPGYKVPFTLKTNIGDLQCQVTGDFYGSEVGSARAGRYFAGGLKPWFEHNKVKPGDRVVISSIDPMKVYSIDMETDIGGTNDTSP